MIPKKKQNKKKRHMKPVGERGHNNRSMQAVCDLESWEQHDPHFWVPMLPIPMVPMVDDTTGGTSGLRVFLQREHLSPRSAPHHPEHKSILQSTISQARDTRTATLSDHNRDANIGKAKKHMEYINFETAVLLQHGILRAERPEIK